MIGGSGSSVSVRRVVSLLVFLPTATAAQVVRSTASPIMPWAAGSDVNRSSRSSVSAADAARMLALYAAPYLGVPGVLDTTRTVDAKTGHHFPTIHFVFSAAARIQPSGTETKLARSLRRMNIHISVEGLDSSNQPIPNGGGVDILELQPNTQLYSETKPDTTTVSGSAVTAVTAVSRSLVDDVANQLGKRVGPVIASFKNVFHHKSAPTQVSYISDPDEFGWTFYEHAEDTLEGMHRAAVLLEVQPAVRFVVVRVELATDWLHHGSWRRQFEYVIDLGPG